MKDDNLDLDFKNFRNTEMDPKKLALIKSIMTSANAKIKNVKRARIVTIAIGIFYFLLSFFIISFNDTIIIESVEWLVCGAFYILCAILFKYNAKYSLFGALAYFILFIFLRLQLILIIHGNG